ncbi:uncharacterized protein LOC112568800 [Pomacea canaliculata]|uniref:uncharacterized protein LOC112568800 n=1 Tax=Pomacea canaliculata TaxID=400727 RepID=UPI000D72D5C9|nr:uncharacterized protein LOC112568800 [Pomacea canaliculata]
MKAFWRRFVLFIFLIDLWFTIICSQETTKTCAELKLDDAAHGVNIFQVTEGSYFNISFKLTTNKCQVQPAWFRVKVSTTQKNRHFPFCTIIFHNQICNVTDNSQGCHCFHDNLQPRAWIYRKASLSDMVQILEWTDSKVSGTQKEETFILSVSPKPETERRVTLLTFAIASATTFPLLIFIVVTITCIIRRRAQVSDQRAKNERVATKEEDIHHYSTLNHAGQVCEAKVINHTSYTEAASSSQSHCSSSLEATYEPFEQINEYMEPGVPVKSLLADLKEFFKNKS